MWKILYHEMVIAEDFKKILQGEQKKIFRAIHKKLATDPVRFGKPLLRELRGYYRLRIGYFRVIYRIEKKNVVVYVVHVGLRKDFQCYMETARRLKLLQMFVFRKGE